MTPWALLFAAGIHEVISKFAAEHAGAWSIWYLDDGTIVGDLTRLNEFARIGLVMNICKYHIVSATSTELFPLLRYHPLTESEGVC